jgi:membrane protein implicated in regulation of membrane protease activity
MNTLAPLLPGLLLGGLQAAASKRQRRRLIVVAGLGLVAFAALSASCILFGWGLFLAYGAALAPHWAAMAASGTLLGFILVLGIVAALVWIYWPSHGLQEEIDKLRHEIEPLARKHPLASVGVAAGLGVLLTSILKR